MNKLIEKIVYRLEQIEEELQIMECEAEVDSYGYYKERCGVEISQDIINEEAKAYNEVKSNADYIRSLSDEELAEWLTKITDDAQLDARTHCNYQWEDWLKAEMEG